MIQRDLAQQWDMKQRDLAQRDLTKGVDNKGGNKQWETRDTPEQAPLHKVRRGLPASGKYENSWRGDR